MIEILIALYIAVALGGGVAIFLKTRTWISRTEPIVPIVRTRDAFLYGLLSIILAVVGEVIIMGFSYLLGFSIFLGLAVGVGFIEEGAKLLPYAINQRDALKAWAMATKAAFFFGLLETLALFPNVFAMLLRIPVIMLHVALTAIALQGYLEGSPIKSYLKASILHSLYDAPILLFIGQNSLATTAVLPGVLSIAVIYRSVDEAFHLAYSKAKKEIEERKLLESGNSTSWDSTSLP